MASPFIKIMLKKKNLCNNTDAVAGHNPKEINVGTVNLISHILT